MLRKKNHMESHTQKKTPKLKDRESYHCLMIDLNDFISSMDFLTAVGEGLEDAERGTVISCCSISVSCQWISDEADVYIDDHSEAWTYSFRCPGDDMQTIVCWFDIHALWGDMRNSDVTFGSKLEQKSCDQSQSAVCFNLLALQHGYMGLSWVFFEVPVKACLLFKYRQQNLDVRPCSEAQSNTP